jgi:Zinc knuckle
MQVQLPHQQLCCPPINPKLLEMSAEAMMLLVLEEYDRKADSNPIKSKDVGVAASIISSKKPGSKTEGGKGGKGKGPRKPIGVCWNCGGKGHKQDECPSPKPDENSKDQKAPSTKGNLIGSKPKPAAGPSNTTNMAASATLDEVAGACRKSRYWKLRTSEDVQAVRANNTPTCVPTASPPPVTLNSICATFTCTSANSGNPCRHCRHHRHHSYLVASCLVATW